MQKRQKHEKKIPIKQEKNPLFYATFQCGRYDIFKTKLIFFDAEKVKKRA